MNVKQDIETHASEENKPILQWLFDNYHMQSEWRFVARCTHERYGCKSYETNRIWTPTKEGVILYNHWLLAEQDKMANEIINEILAEEKANK